MIKLNKDQQRAFNLIESSRSNYFLHGEPGTGKSVLINALCSQGKKQYFLTAPTGMAAVNIGGKTIHSLLNIPGGVIPPNYNKFVSFDGAVNNIRYNLKSLVIDEISMLRVDVLDFIDRSLRHIKEDQRPFGGVQIIAVGDFFQLPPVVKHEEQPLLEQDGWNTPFCFSHKLFKTFIPIRLKKIERQTNKQFLNILSQCRYGNISKANLTLLNKQVKPLKKLCIQLVGTNRKCDEINMEQLDKLPGKSTEFHADNYGSWPAFPVETVIDLKVGAQVLVKKNGADIQNGRPRGDSEIVNGTIGKVKEINEDSVVITVKNKDHTIFRARWERKERELRNGEWTEKVVAAFEQIPLKLAWAISMHKSQGQTFDQVHIDPSRIFADGQLYVAVSRCRTLKGITFERRVFPHFFRTNKEVIKFHSKLK